MEQLEGLVISKQWVIEEYYFKYKLLSGWGRLIVAKVSVVPARETRDIAFTSTIPRRMIMLQ